MADRADLTTRAPAARGGASPLGTLAVLFALALILYGAGAAPREITKGDEHRYLAVARDFAAHGDWLYCRLNGVEYTHKPPLFFWAIAICREIGLSWTGSGKLPSVVAAAVATTALFDLARRLWGRVAGWAAVVALVGTKEYFLLACRANLDATLSACTTLAVYAFARATLCAATARARTTWTTVGFVAVGAGVLVKGPPALVIPGSAVLVTLLWDDRWRSVSGWRWAAGLLVLVVPPDEVGLPLGGAAGWAARIGGFLLLTRFDRSRWGALATWRWALAPLALALPVAWVLAAAWSAPSGWEYVRDLTLGHGVAHAVGRVSKLESWWFYAKTFPAGLLPWTLLAPAVVWAWLRAPRPGSLEADRLAAAWVVAPLVAMSLSPAKRDLYLVPVYPATALLVARTAAVLAAHPAAFHARAVQLGLRAFGWGVAAIGVALGVVGLLRIVGADAPIGWAWDAWAIASPTLESRVPWWALVLGATLAACAGPVTRPRRFARCARAVAACVGLLVAITALVHAPFTNALGSPRRFLRMVKERTRHAPIVDYGGSAHAVSWLCDRRVVPVAPTRARAEQMLGSWAGPVYFTIERRRLGEPHKGVPTGARVLLRESRRGAAGFLLIGRE